MKRKTPTFEEMLAADPSLAGRIKKLPSSAQIERERGYHPWLKSRAVAPKPPAEKASDKPDVA